jgi:hypothetical protein
MTPSPTNNSRTILPALVLAACLATAAQATTWIVDAANGPGTNFTTISAAIAAAQPGDRILVRQAFYGENVVVNKAVTIVGWNATTYPMTVPINPFQFAVWGTFGVTNIPFGQTCVISGLILARPSPNAGTTVGVLNCPGTVVLDRLIIPNGGLFIGNCTDVFLEQVQVRHLQGELPPIPGVTITNSWVQANDLDATGGDLTTEPDFFPSAGHGLWVENNSIVALARPKLIGGFGGGPWITSASTPAGGAAIYCETGGVVSIVDDVGSSSYLVGGQGGLRGVGSVSSIPSGNGGNAIEVVSAGTVNNKKPMPLFGGAPGLNTGGGQIGVNGAGSATSSGGTYAAIVDLPSLYRHISGSVPDGFFIFVHHAAGPGLPVAIAVMPDMQLNIYPPSLQFAGGNPFTAIVLATGTSDALGFVAFGFGLPAAAVGPHVGASVVVQTADDVVNTLFLSNPSPWILGF